MSTPARIIATFFLCALVMMGWAATTIAWQDGTAGATPEAAPAVTREVLSEADPDSAPGEVLALVRYVIPAGSVLPAHTHPGVQMATVESGTLTYHVVADGELSLTRADGTEETVRPGETVELAPGDAWVEPEGMVHYAENLTDEDVVLIATSLFDADEPAAILVSGPGEASPVASPVS